MLEQWLKADGDHRKPTDLAGGATCDRLGCTMDAFDGRKIAWIKYKRAFAEDCARADLVITPRIAPQTCAAAFVIDRVYLGRYGATAMRLTHGSPSIAHARGDQRPLPWRLRTRPETHGTSGAAPDTIKPTQPDPSAPEDTDTTVEVRPESLQ